MSYVSFYGSGETAGSMAKLRKGETAGSVGHTNEEQNLRRESVSIETSNGDSVSFRGKEQKEGSSIAKSVFCVGLMTAAIIAGLGYAHKAGWTSKLNEGKLKEGLDKVTGKCHDWCHTVKEFGTKQYEKIKAYFHKKS